MLITVLISVLCFLFSKQRMGNWKRANLIMISAATTERNTVWFIRNLIFWYLAHKFSNMFQKRICFFSFPNFIVISWMGFWINIQKCLTIIKLLRKWQRYDTFLENVYWKEQASCKITEMCLLLCLFSPCLGCLKIA